MWKFLVGGLIYFYHGSSAYGLKSIIEAGLIAGGKGGKQGRQTVFFTAVDRVNEAQKDQPYVVSEPRVVPYRTKWRVHQNAVFWIDLKSCSGQRTGILTNNHPERLSATRLFW